ncbi:MAG: alpha/beta hydrolase [Rhodospirillales bacterium]|nr:alpha/beta hydrolase [Acetobacter sp.]
MNTHPSISDPSVSPASTIHSRRVNVDGLNLFYREAGSPENPTLVLLHGYPSSSFMFRDLMARLADRFHLIAPDYPGFGNSDAPPPAEFEYSFDHFSDIIDRLLEALRVTKHSFYMQGYGAPIGFRLATKHPERVQAFIIQNGNAYEEGFSPAWTPFRALWQNRNPETEAAIATLFAPKSTQFFYTEGARDPGTLNPDAWNMDQFFLDRAANQAANMEIFYDFRKNLPLVDQWHAYFRDHQPSTLIVWGENDPFFTVDGAKAYLRDLPRAELHLLPTGHTALEEEGATIADHIRRFLPTVLFTAEAKGRSRDDTMEQSSHD